MTCEDCLCRAVCYIDLKIGKLPDELKAISMYYPWTDIESDAIEEMVAPLYKFASMCPFFKKNENGKQGDTK